MQNLEWATAQLYWKKKKNLCCNIEIVLQAIGEKAVRLCCNTIFCIVTEACVGWIAIEWFVLQEAWLRTICIAIQWIVLWLRQGSDVLQYSHCSSDTARRPGRWAHGLARAVHAVHSAWFSTGFFDSAFFLSH